LPISGAEGFHGVVDLVTMEAYYYTPGGDGRGKATGEIPASLAADAKARHEALVELVGRGQDELMRSTSTRAPSPWTTSSPRSTKPSASAASSPCSSPAGLANMAVDHLLDFIKVYAPAPVERALIAVRNPSIDASASGDPDAGKSTRKIADSEPVGLVVFKTMTDPFCRSHHLLQGHRRRGQKRRHPGELHPPRPGAFVASIGHAGPQGRRGSETPRRRPGRRGQSCAKPSPGDTLGQKGAEIQVDLFPLPEPAMTYAIEPKSRADEDKLAPAIHNSWKRTC